MMALDQKNQLLNLFHEKNRPTLTKWPQVDTKQSTKLLVRQSCNRFTPIYGKRGEMRLMPVGKLALCSCKVEMAYSTLSTGKEQMRLSNHKITKTRAYCIYSET